MHSYKLYPNNVFSRKDLRKEKPLDPSFSLSGMLLNPQDELFVDIAVEPRDNFERVDYKKGRIITEPLVINYGPRGDEPVYPFMLFINSPESVRTHLEQGAMYALDNAFDANKLYSITSRGVKFAALRETSKIEERLLFVGSIEEFFDELKEIHFNFSKEDFRQNERGDRLEKLFKRYNIYHDRYNPSGKEYHNSILYPLG